MHYLLIMSGFLSYIQERHNRFSFTRDLPLNLPRVDLTQLIHLIYHYHGKTSHGLSHFVSNCLFHLIVYVVLKD